MNGQKAIRCCIILWGKKKSLAVIITAYRNMHKFFFAFQTSDSYILDFVNACSSIEQSCPIEGDNANEDWLIL